MAQQWLSIVEYARAFSVSDMTVRRRIKTGKLQSVLRDGKYYIPVEVGVDGGYIKPTSKKTHIPQQPKQPTSNQRPPQPAETDFEIIRSQRPMQSPPTHVQKEIHNFDLDIPAQKMNHARQDSGIVEVCQKMLTKLDSTEQLMSSKYQAQMQALASDNRRKDGEIAQLRQQIEDLQVLVKILESNSN